MRLFVTQGELNNPILSFNNTHGKATHGLDINTKTLIDLIKLVMRLALMLNGKKNVISKPKANGTPLSLECIKHYIY